MQKLKGQREGEGKGGNVELDAKLAGGAKSFC